MNGPGAVVVAVAVLLVSGCGDEAMERTITEQQAYDKVERHVRDAATALPSEAWLELTSPAASPGVWPDGTP